VVVVVVAVEVLVLVVENPQQHQTQRTTLSRRVERIHTARKWKESTRQQKDFKSVPPHGGKKILNMYRHTKAKKVS